MTSPKLGSGPAYPATYYSSDHVHLTLESYKIVSEAVSKAILGLSIRTEDQEKFAALDKEVEQAIKEEACEGK